MQELYYFLHCSAYLDASSLVMIGELGMIWLSHVENCVYVVATLGINLLFHSFFWLYVQNYYFLIIKILVEEFRIVL